MSVGDLGRGRRGVVCWLTGKKKVMGAPMIPVKNSSLYATIFVARAEETKMSHKGSVAVKGGKKKGSTRKLRQSRD